MAEFHLVHNDCFKVMRDMSDTCINAVVTDPPYSSGGLHASSRRRPTREKYAFTESQYCDNIPNFAHDNKDQRSWMHWTAEWLNECYRVITPGGIIATFIDWRQLPAMSDAIQWSNFIWQGVMVWDKGPSTRPRKGGYRQQCEFIVWASKGIPNQNNNYGLGCFKYPPITNNKVHITQKPVPLMADILHPFKETEATIFDPFMGSGTTGVACAQLGLNFIGAEMVNSIYETARERINDAYNTLQEV